MAKPCKHCGSILHPSFKCFRAPRKAIKQTSPKQDEYNIWLEEVARPAVLARDGNICQCCSRPARQGEKLDLDHKDGKGSHPKSKKDIKNLQLLCRFPCHRNKTDHVPCNH